MKTNESAYLRFTALADTITSELAQDIDLTSKCLLEIIAVASVNGNPITVTQAMNHDQIASPATIHRKLTHLLEEGYVEQVFEGKNRRTKYLVPTAKADKYFVQMGQMLKSVLQS
jgi:DNA-binding MarR family transcriptional regulator